ncbi:MAG: NACHT domain-containing protein, partial [Chloroflexi bacterium]|nr:NACHT domain-containing protein [Chloroflexota bacterium]
MAFDLSHWREQLAATLRDWKPRMQRAGVNSVYAFLSAAALWPVAEAARGGDWAAPAVLGGVLGALGTNLLANRIQGWKDEAGAAHDLAQAAPQDPALRAELDAVLEKLEAIPLARESLAEAGRAWFEETLRAELERMGNLPRFQIALQSGGVNISHLTDSQLTVRDVTGGDKTEINVWISDPKLAASFLAGLAHGDLSPDDLREATRRYLQYVVDRYRYLDFKGMGVSDRVPLRLSLPDLYVPLKARIELPRGETWLRELRLAGREVPQADREAVGERLSEPTPLMDLLQKHSGLIILGDPGAGKTTFLKFLALELAAGADARLPVLVPLSAYANALAEKEGTRLDEFMADYFHTLGADLPLAAMLRRALAAGSAVVMLDGLDEVKELRLRDTVVRRVVDFYTFHHPAGNKFLLTSRIIGYREVRPTAPGLAECTLVDFDDEEIEAFVTRWTAAIEKAARGETAVAAQEAARERQELLEAVRRNPGVRALAANPLLLTILALMKRQGVTLPERRVALYHNYVETLLSSWNRARGLGRPPARDLDVPETLKVLAPLALWMHEVAPGVGLVKQRDLLQRLEAIYHERGEANPEQAARRFLTDVREYSGLLLERGSGQYGFIHLTFEEYLAAVALAGRGQQSVQPVVAALAAHAGDPTWREASLLTVGYLGLVQQREQAAGAVVEGLLSDAAGEPGEAIVLAGDAVADVGPGGVTPACKNNTVAVLLDTMQDDSRVKAPLRARAGTTLARLGDPRPGVDPAVTALEQMEFCCVPAGPFVMGEDEKGNEKKHTNRALDYDYWLARYPVTVAQFRAFVQASGHKPRDEDSLRGPANHPVRYVT